jgi:hypothetical protein
VSLRWTKPRAGVQIALVEESEAEGILNYRTVNLPILFIGGERIALTSYVCNLVM